ncbi:serine hydrolase domain-containing protein [Aspergillus mulundensis]|uniref:Beta-lactamase-related domain-containing protein n=1 Tax=Aspergillus mulundensis TaxID=1810919 RepID=A0A3D8QVM9_9EURO|nr:hypothetical protein DSM5745_09497 [Aspergillus mulundensis]RDW65758.1 hypothetical protein DSM5745_09497 [Aspergillus mulundensis]
MTVTSPFTEETLSTLRTLVDNACADPKTTIPGATVVIVDKTGTELFAHSAGKRGAHSSEPMTLDNIFWIASCTKMLVGVAVMQLVEKNILNLDDKEQIESLCPELRDLKVLKEDGTLEEKKNAITLRMLLTHTAGFGYTFFNDRLREWSYPAGVDEFSGRMEDVKTPLLFQPGEGWEYGVGLDWAGIALQRATGLTLNEYLQKHIFAPLGIKEMSMIPNEDMRRRMAYMNHRGEDGTLRPRDHLLRAPLVVDLNDEAEIKRVFDSGGAGVNPRRPPEQRNVPENRRPAPVSRHSRHHVHEPDPAYAALQSAEHPRVETRSDEPDSRALPCCRRPTAGMGPDLYAE